MGLLPCPLPCKADKEIQSHSNHLHLESSSSSLSSQPSLPSILSLCQPLQQPPTCRHQCIATLKGHSSYIFSFVLAGKFLYSGSCNSEIRVWSREPCAEKPIDDDNIVVTGNSAVKSLVVLKDKLFTAHQDHKIRVWQINDTIPHQKFKCIATLPTLNDRFMRLFSTKNYVQVRRHKKCTWVHHVDTVSALAISRDGSLLYSASWDRTFKIWRSSDFKCLESVERAHDDAINAIVLSDDGFVYTGSADKKIKAWKKFSGQKKQSLVATLERHRSAVNALALSPDGSVLYSGACDRSILVWERDDSDTGHMVVSGALRGHTKAILSLAVVADLVFSGSADNTVRIWRRSGLDNGYTCLAVLERHRRPVKCLTVAIDSYNNNNDRVDSDSATSYLLYSGSLDCDIKVWQIWVPLL